MECYILKYEQYFPIRFCNVRSPLLNLSASRGRMRSRTFVLPLNRAVRL